MRTQIWMWSRSRIPAPGYSSVETEDDRAGKHQRNCGFSLPLAVYMPVEARNRMAALLDELAFLAAARMRRISALISRPFLEPLTAFVFIRCRQSATDFGQTQSDFCPGPFTAGPIHEARKWRIAGPPVPRGLIQEGARTAVSAHQSAIISWNTRTGCPRSFPALLESAVPVPHLRIFHFVLGCLCGTSKIRDP